MFNVHILIRMFLMLVYVSCYCLSFLPCTYEFLKLHRAIVILLLNAIVAGKTLWLRKWISLYCHHIYVVIQATITPSRYKSYLDPLFDLRLLPFSQTLYNQSVEPLSSTQTHRRIPSPKKMGLTSWSVAFQLIYVHEYVRILHKCIPQNAFHFA